MRLTGFAMHEQRDRHAPGALTRDGPVRTAVDHAGDARPTPARKPFDLFDRVQRVVAQIRLGHRDEPLRRGAERHGLVMPPAVRITVADLVMRQQRADVAQRFDDHLIRLPDVQARQHGVAQRRRRRQIHAAAVDRIQLRGGVLFDQPVFQANREVFLAVAGRGVYSAGAVFGGHVIAKDQRDVAFCVERMCEDDAFQRSALRAAETLDLNSHFFFRVVAIHSLCYERFGEHQQLTLTVTRGTFDQRIFQLRAERDRQRRGQCPRRGRPDRYRDRSVAVDIDTKLRRQRMWIARGVSDINGRRLLVFVFDLSFRQRRPTVEAPVHRLHTAQQMAVLDHFRQRAHFVGFETEIKRSVRVVPVAQHTQSLEIAALDVDLLVGEFAAFRAELRGVELHPDFAVLFLDRQLDRQTVTVPARHVRRVEAGHRLRFDDDVFENFVDRMTEMDRAVGVRWAVMQHERRPAFGFFAQLHVQPLALPAGQGVGLALGQIAAHRKLRCRQMDRGLVALVVCSAVLIAHAVARSVVFIRICRACAASRSICATSVGRSGNFSSSRSRATNSMSISLP